MGLAFFGKKMTYTESSTDPPAKATHLPTGRAFEVEYKRPTRAHPLRDFHKISRVCTPFQDALALKIWLNLLKGLWSYGGFKLMVWLSPNSQAPSGKNIHQTPKVLEVQERARGHLSSCQVWWGSDFTRRPDQNVELLPTALRTAQIAGI